MIPDSFFSNLFLVPSLSLFFAFCAPFWAPNWIKNTKSWSRKVLFFAYPFSSWNVMDCYWFLCFFKISDPLPTSGGPMEYALFSKSLFSLPRGISELFLTSFWSFWPPQIGWNRVGEALLDRSDFSSNFGIHLFDLLMIFGSPRRL